MPLLFHKKNLSQNIFFYFFPPIESGNVQAGGDASDEPFSAVSRFLESSACSSDDLVMRHVILTSSLAIAFQLTLQSDQEAILLFLFAVSVSLKYGYYGDCRMVLGPSSSRLMQASSVFVEQVEVRDDDKKGVRFYTFTEKPELSYQANWSVSNYVIVGSYSRKVEHEIFCFNSSHTFQDQWWFQN